MPYSRPYASGFVDYPSTTTPINSTALNTMDVGIKTANDQFQTVTTAQRTALVPTVGQCVWDSDLRQLMVFMNASGGNAWQPIGNRLVCASTTRPATPFEGQEIYETDTNKTYIYSGSAWVEIVDITNIASNPVQRNIQSTTKTDVFTSTSTSLVDITGLSVSITPSSVTSKVLVIVSLSIIATNSGGNYNQRGAILRGSTIIGGGTPASLRPAASFTSLVLNAYGIAPLTMVHLDSPATTSATTYKVQAGSEAGGGAGFAINRSIYSDADNAGYPRLASSITVIEVPV